MNPRFAQIPGYLEACQEQDLRRDAVFLDLPETLCGFPVVPMTARHLAILTHCRNGFVCGGEIAPEHIAQVLWCLSPDYSPTDPKRRDKIVTSVAALRYGKAVAEIRAHVDAVFMDSPAGESGKPSESYNSWIAGLVDLLAKEYGWTQREIVNLPLACVFQYVRLIRARTGTPEPQFNRLSDAARDAYLTQLNAN